MTMKNFTIKSVKENLGNDKRIIEMLENDNDLERLGIVIEQMKKFKIKKEKINYDYEYKKLKNDVGKLLELPGFEHFKNDPDIMRGIEND